MMRPRNLIESRGRLASLVATGLLIVAASALTLSRGFYTLTANDAFFSLTLASTAIVFLYVRPWAEALHLVSVFCLLLIAQTFALKVPLSRGSGFALLGLSSLGLLALRMLWSAGDRRQQLRYAFLPPLLFVLLGYAGSAPLQITGELHPQTLDFNLYAFDASLGGQLSFVVGRVVLQSRWLTQMSLFWYYVLPEALMLVYAKQLVRHRSVAATVFLAFFLLGPIGVIFYNLVPACGPAYLFGSNFPLHALAAKEIQSMAIGPVAVPGARNAFPSLHIAWALLAWWYSGNLSRLSRLLVLLFLVGTVLATLGLGEHYFVDLVAAFPFALMMQAACALQIPMRDWRRLAPLLAGLFLTLGWVVLLRWWLRIVWLSPLIPWTLIACTILSCIVLQARLGKLIFSGGNLSASEGQVEFLRV